MNSHASSRLPALLQKHEAELLTEWVREQQRLLKGTSRLKEQEMQARSAEFLTQLRKVAQEVGFTNPSGPAWEELRSLLNEVSRSRSLEGYTPSETATFVFSLKKPLFAVIRRDLANDPEALAQETWRATEVLDELGLYTTEIYQKAREEVIQRQQQEMLELSTPVVKLWVGSPGTELEFAL